ncbi:MAG: sigma 54-interacting transcriptional regulator, partial [Pseudomonadota bacterium]
QAGAYSFLEKPYDPRRLLTLLRNAAHQRRLRQDADRLRRRLADLSGLDRALPGNHPPIRVLRDEITELRDAKAAVLLQGEAGVGKLATARAMHDLGANPAGPFVVVTCSDPAQLKDALEDERSLIVRASDGTLVLDDVSAAAADLQAPLQRLLETAADNLRSGSFRLIATSDQGLEEAVASGAFRRDLYYQLSAVLLTIPPLRERGEDIALIYAQSLAETAAVYETETPEVNADDIAALLAHNWPDNLRELRHIAERHVLAARRGRGSVAEALRLDVYLGDTPETLREAVAAFERRLIARALKQHEGRMDDVAEGLGIGRRTLNEKIVKLGLDKSQVL